MDSSLRMIADVEYQVPPTLHIHPPLGILIKHTDDVKNDFMNGISDTLNPGLLLLGN